MTRNLVWGGTLAAMVAVLLIVPTVGGVSTWKWMLAAAGLALFVLAGRKESPRR